MKYKIGVALMVCVVALVACHKSDDIVSEENKNAWYSGGMQTTFTTGSGAFGQMFNGLTAQQAQWHHFGDAAFEATFNSDVQQRNHGLGPLWNNQSCGSCHVADGRGKAPEAGELPLSLLLRISIPGAGEYGAPVPVPGYGGQLQQRAIFGVTPEADIQVSYTETAGTFPDGEVYSLRKPTYVLTNAYTSLPGEVLISPRMASPVFGLGLLENISEADILRYADEDDADGNGISGKPNYAWDVLSQRVKLGRFGWKAVQPTVLQQSAGAYNEDMGITSFIFPTESSSGQPQYASSSTSPEVADSTLFAVAYYVRTLCVPGRRNADQPQVLQGEQLFMDIGCGACHVPSYTTATDHTFTEGSNQRIYPYTDLLLHDMGEGLADHRPDHRATGYEWRTAPLWGIGLTRVVNDHNNFLHDGRARNLTEAILWHGGESETSKQRFTALSAAERKAVIAFLETL